MQERFTDLHLFSAVNFCKQQAVCPRFVSAARRRFSQFSVALPWPCPPRRLGRAQVGTEIRALKEKILDLGLQLLFLLANNAKDID
jgi:hypothetical protein